MKESDNKSSSNRSEFIKKFTSLLSIAVLLTWFIPTHYVFANEQDSEMIPVDAIISYHNATKTVYIGEKVDTLVFPKEVSIVHGETWKSVYVSWEPEVSIDEFSSDGVFTKTGTIKYKMVLPNGYYIPEGVDFSETTEITVNIEESPSEDTQKYPYATVEDSMIKIYTSKYKSQLAYCYNQSLARPGFDEKIPYDTVEEYIGQENQNAETIKSLINIGYPFDALGLRGKYNVSSDMEAYGETQSVLWGILGGYKPVFLSDYGKELYNTAINNQGSIPNRGEFSLSDTPRFTYIEDRDYYESQELQIIGYNGEVNLNLPDGVEIYKKSKTSSNIVSTKDIFKLRVSSDLVKSNGKFIMSIDKYLYEYPEKITFYKSNKLNEDGIAYQNLLSFEKTWIQLEDERYFEINVEDSSMEEVEKPEQVPDQGEDTDQEQGSNPEQVPDQDEDTDQDQGSNPEQVPGKDEDTDQNQGSNPDIALAPDQNQDTELAKEPDQSVDSDQSKDNSNNIDSTTSPQTGDTGIAIYVGLGILALIFLGISKKYKI